MITVAAGLHLVVGTARPGRMHEGIPPGGAAVPELLAAANRAAGRDEGEAAVEHWGPITLAGAGWVATPEGVRRVDGELVVRPALRVGYVVLKVEVDVEAAATSGAAVAIDLTGPIRVVRGPDGPAVSLVGPWRVGAVGNRVGIRLDGPPIDGRVVRGASAPMVRGAIQAPPSGELIVLGPDHPTTGGYPVVAVVCAVDVGKLFARTPASSVELVAISVAAARRLRHVIP
jgi:allophanate hydrolase subunit 2